jgi:hypothetical protein
MVLDVEGFQDAARSAGVLKLLESLHRHTPGRKILIAGFDLGQPEGAFPFRGATWPIHLRTNASAVGPPPRSEEDEAFRAFLLQRTDAQRDIVRRCGVVSLGMYVSQVDSDWELQKLYFRRWAEFMAERYPGVDRAAWVGNFQVFRWRDEAKTRLRDIPPRELAEYVAIIRDHVEIAILFGHWDQSEPLYRMMLEAKRQD